MKVRLLPLLLILPLACDSGDVDDVDGAGDSSLAGGKADAADVDEALQDLIADGVIDEDDVRALFASAGNRVSRGEMQVIADALQGDVAEVLPEALALGKHLAMASNLSDPEVALLDAGVTRAGNEIPEAVREIVGRARLNGAIALDVRETNNSGNQIWTPYPATTPPIGNMTFEYTNITPQVLADDIADTTVTYNAIVGSETAEQCNAAGQCTEFRQARYQQRTGGTGNVATHFDEVHHPDLFARGSQGQKWTNNCAILMDGSMHCLPAPRRSQLRDVILTNPALSRCNSFAAHQDACSHVLFLGHIDVRAGVVTRVNLSGRVSRRVAQGRADLVDPIAILEAWGFELSPTLRLTFDNTSDGTPIVDAERGIVTQG